MRQIVLIAHDIRSCHNVGSLLRTADGFGLEHVYLTGYTPYPQLATHDPRLPHMAAKAGRQIHKTALGAEDTQAWSIEPDVELLLAQLAREGYRLVALEQSARSINLTNYQPPDRTALLIGSEVEGIESNLLKKMNDVLEIPMLGAKESFNVVQASAVALYHLRFTK